MPRKSKTDSNSENKNKPPARPTERFSFCPVVVVEEEESASKKRKPRRSGSGGVVVVKRKKPRVPHTRTLPFDVLRLSLAELHDRPRTLLMLSSVSRELRQLIRHNHALLAHVYRHSIHWLCSHWLLGPAIEPPIGGMWTPKRAWETQGVPAADRERFNAYVYKLMVMQFAQHCSLCGPTEEQCTPIWALGLRVCGVCMRANLVSHRALWLDYGVWVGGSLPTNTRAVALAIEWPFHVRGMTVFDMLKASVFMFVDRSVTAKRRAFTSHPADLVRGIRDREEDTLFMWRPHLNRVLRLDKARANMPLRIAAAETLKAYARLLNVQRLLQQKKAQSTPLERLMGGDKRPAWPLPSGAKCYFSSFRLRPTGESIRAVSHGLGWNPHYTAPYRRAWAPLSASKERGVYHHLLLC
jgi:hypothetical protein